MARDFESERHSERLRAVLDDLEKENVVLVLTLQQAIENLRYLNEEVVGRRLRFLIHLSNRPNVGWIQSLTTEGMGSIVDVVAAEVEARLRSPATSVADMITEVRSRIFRFGSLPTGDFVDLHTLRRLLAEQVDRDRELVSLAFGDFFDSGLETVGDLRRANARSWADAQRVLHGMKAALASNLRTGGDKKLQDPDGTATRFVTELASGLPQPRKDESPVDAILRYVGLDPQEVPDATPCKNVSTRAVFKAQMDVVKRVLNLPDDAVDSLDPRDLPSFLGAG